MLTQVIFTVTLKIGSVFIPIVQTRELRHVEAKGLAQGHTASKGWSQGLNPGHLVAGGTL